METVASHSLQALHYSSPAHLTFSPCPGFSVAPSSDKRVPEQTGRSAQLQDASVARPEEGCRAVFIHQGCRGSRSFNTTS